MTTNSDNVNITLTREINKLQCIHATKKKQQGGSPAVFISHKNIINLIYLYSIHRFVIHYIEYLLVIQIQISYKI